MRPGQRCQHSLGILCTIGTDRQQQPDSPAYTVSLIPHSTSAELLCRCQSASPGSAVPSLASARYAGVIGTPKYGVGMKGGFRCAGPPPIHRPLAHCHSLPIHRPLAHCHLLPLTALWLTALHCLLLTASHCLWVQRFHPCSLVSNVFGGPLDRAQLQRLGHSCLRAGRDGRHRQLVTPTCRMSSSMPHERSHRILFIRAVAPPPSHQCHRAGATALVQLTHGHFADFAAGTSSASTTWRSSQTSPAPTLSGTLGATT